MRIFQSHRSAGHDGPEPELRRNEMAVDTPSWKPARAGRAAYRAGVPIAAALALLAGCGMFKKDAPKVEIPVEPVARRTITLSVDATGTVEPIDLVEVKSKASGQILKMPVAVGSVVKAGDLLAQIDKVDVQNAYDQARAALVAAETRAKVSTAQKQRADDLLASGVITAEEHETAELDHANAQSALVQARTNLSSAKQRLDDATVRAPIAGTVLAQPVAVGQVISSATSSVSGGTTLLTMADLSRIRMRVLVSETDIGNVKPGQPATVSVDAYPNRPFRGQVEKIEPQAVVQQSVTQFPVLVSLDNEEGLLLPGMNGEVTMLVARQNDVLAVPVDALRSMREAGTVATALGLQADSVRSQVRAQMMALAAGTGGTGGASADSARAARRAANGGAGRAGGGFNRGGPGGGAAGRPGGAGGRSFGGGAGGRSFGAGAGGAAGAGGSQAQVAFVKTANGYEPRAVRIGISDFEYTQVVDGLKEGDQVVLLSVAEIQAQRSALTDRIRSRMGSGLTNSSSSNSSSGSGGGR
jgi:HlyD family secretion protein